MQQNNRFKQIRIHAVLTIATNTSTKRPRVCAPVAINTLKWSQINDSTEDTIPNITYVLHGTTWKKGATMSQSAECGATVVPQWDASLENTTRFELLLCPCSVYLWLEKQWKRVADELWVTWRTNLKGLEFDIGQSTVVTRCRNFVNWSTFSALHLAANI
jgi:hypothetical protein